MIEAVADQDEELMMKYLEGEELTEEEIKKVYKELAKKYHPDLYQNNPLAELAEEKLKEIKELIKLPVVAIGGLSLSNIDKLKECNVDGYAVVSAILGAENIKLECEKWIEKI